MDVNVTFKVANPTRWADELLLQAQQAQDLRYQGGTGQYFDHRPDGPGRWVVTERWPGGSHSWKLKANEIVQAAAYVLQGAEDINLGDGGSRSVHESIAASFIYDDASSLGPWTADAVLQRATFGKVLWSSDVAPPPLTP